MGSFLSRTRADLSGFRNRHVEKFNNWFGILRPLNYSRSTPACSMLIVLIAQAMRGVL